MWRNLRRELTGSAARTDCDQVEQERVFMAVGFKVVVTNPRKSPNLRLVSDEQVHGHRRVA